MGYEAQSRDLTSQYLSYGRILSDYRPVPSANFAPGTVCQLVSLDNQVYNDAGTVQPCVTVAAQQYRIVGVVADTWPGFNGAVPPQTFVSPWTTNPKLRGTQGVLLVVQGYHPAVLVDNSDASSTAITDGTILIPSLATTGYVEGAAAWPQGVGMGGVGVAMLPGSGPLSSLGNGAVVQASGGTITYSANLGVNAVATVTIALPGGPSFTYSYTNTTGAAQTPTAIAAAMGALIAVNPYFTTTVAAGVITVNVAPGSRSYLANSAIATAGSAQFPISLSGTIGNGVTITGSPGAFVNPSGGTGYYGTVPAFIKGAAC